MTVWVVEDYTFNDIGESHIAGIYSSLQKAKEKVILYLEYEIKSIIEELNDKESLKNEYSEGYIVNLKYKLEDYKRAVTQLYNPEYYSIGNYFDICDFTITEHTIDK